MKFSAVILLGLILSHSAFSSSFVSDFEIKTSKDCREVEFVEQKSLLVPIDEFDPNSPPSGVITTGGEFFAIKPIGIYSGTILPFPKPVPKPTGGSGGGVGGPGRSSSILIDENGIYSGTILPFPNPAPKPTGGSGNGDGGPPRGSIIGNDFQLKISQLINHNETIYICRIIR
ncbi:MAG: hypothetical protein K9K67_14220 [Bacteriovoracaceae bacterium]|nr:hypothetical protein [Bacteriovoracaceae bacterium]